MDERAKVARYRATGYDPGMTPDHNGGWVDFSDYQALAARLTEVEAIAESRLAMIAELPTRAAYEAAEAALARLREEQDAMRALLKRAYDALGEDLPTRVFNKLAFDLECALAAPASDGRNAE